MMRMHVALVTIAAIAFASPPQTTHAQTGKPTLFLIGDLTVKVGTTGQVGWGERIADYFDPRGSPSTALVMGMPSTYMSVVKSWPPMTLPQRPIDCTPGIRHSSDPA